MCLFQFKCERVSDIQDPTLYFFIQNYIYVQMDNISL